MDNIQLSEDVKRFNESMSGVLDDKGIKIQAVLEERPAYGNRVAIIWWMKNEKGEEELLHQSLYRVVEGVGWNMAFFLRKIMNEQTFAFSCKNSIPVRIPEKGDLPIRGGATCADYSQESNEMSSVDGEDGEDLEKRLEECEDKDGIESKRAKLVKNLKF